MSLPCLLLLAVCFLCPTDEEKQRQRDGHRNKSMAPRRGGRRQPTLRAHVLALKQRHYGSCLLQRHPKEATTARKVVVPPPTKKKAPLPLAAVRPDLDRDGAVRVFYHCVLPRLLAAQQSSHLLLYLCRHSRVGASESWHSENVSAPLSGKAPQCRMADKEAHQRLSVAVEGGRTYALRIVVESSGTGAAHALVLLIKGKQSWLVDPNGDFGMVHLYFGAREVLTERLSALLSTVGCSLLVPRLPCLHSPTAPNSRGRFREYTRGGACAFVSGAIALEALKLEDPEQVVRRAASAPPCPDWVAARVDDLISLTLTSFQKGKM